MDDLSIEVVESLPPPSEPPSVKHIRAEFEGRAALLMLAVGALTDWLGIIALYVLIQTRVIPGDWAYGIVLLASPTAIGRARGKFTSASMSAWVVAAKASIAATMRHIVS